MPDHFVINPGSHIGASTSGDGWTNTYLGAEQEARRWLRQMNSDHIDDVELVLPGRPSEDDGFWVFGFRRRSRRDVQGPGLATIQRVTKGGVRGETTRA